MLLRFHASVDGAAEGTDGGDAFEAFENHIEFALVGDLHAELDDRLGGLEVTLRLGGDDVDAELRDHRGDVAQKAFAVLTHDANRRLDRRLVAVAPLDGDDAVGGIGFCPARALERGAIHAVNRDTATLRDETDDGIARARGATLCSARDRTGHALDENCSGKFLDVGSREG